MQPGQNRENLDLVKGYGKITLVKCFKTMSKDATGRAPPKIQAEIPEDEILWEDWDEDEYYGIWANEYDTMPDYFGELLEDYGFLKVYEGGMEYENLYYVACISLAADTDNNALVWLATDYIVDATLTDRTFYKDNKWQTICLPFSLSSFKNTPLEGATVKTLTGSSYEEENGTLTLDFSADLTAIEAGKPYIVKWAGGESLESPMFTGVTVSSDMTNVETSHIDFVGAYFPVYDDEYNVLVLSGDSLSYLESETFVGSCSAYFLLKEELAPQRIVLNFNETQGIEQITNSKSSITYKVIKDGQLLILRGDRTYTIQGQEVK